MTKARGNRSARRAVLKGAAAFGLLCVGGLRPREARARSLKVGQPAPPAVMVTLDGKRIATKELLGRVVILTFWATYCEPCREELPRLSAYAAEHENDGLTVLAFSLDEPDQMDEVRKVAATLKFPVGLLREDSVPGYGRIWRMPANFLIGRDGTLLENGWDLRDSSWTAERLERLVTPLLRER
jgi:thiol-disulfide isomerase/thioredoxin